jgi:hypothetical protein
MADVVAEAPNLKEKTNKPTKKWWATQITALTAWLIALIQNDFNFDTTILIALVGILSQAAIGWLVSNSDEPGGVPTKDLSV